MESFRLKEVFCYKLIQSIDDLVTLSSGITYSTSVIVNPAGCYKTNEWKSQNDWDPLKIDSRILANPRSVWPRPTESKGIDLFTVNPAVIFSNTSRTPPTLQCGSSPRFRGISYIRQRKSRKLRSRQTVCRSDQDSVPKWR